MFINNLTQTSFSVFYVHRLMKLLNIKARIRRKRTSYVKVKPEQVGENILARNFKVEHVNQKWCTDITEFKVPRTYLSFRIIR